MKLAANGRTELLSVLLDLGQPIDLVDRAGTQKEDWGKGDREDDDDTTVMKQRRNLIKKNMNEVICTLNLSDFYLQDIHSSIFSFLYLNFTITFFSFSFFFFFFFFFSWQAKQR